MVVVLEELSKVRRVREEVISRKFKVVGGLSSRVTLLPWRTLPMGGICAITPTCLPVTCSSTLMTQRSNPGMKA
ncbi:hypothetical protein E2C01_008590 [Portunus trituberculatus]|uniref:Uncharacterized protein n=1 Tax=Portunus trituberculatus TaxID=210409 RepID=A0A5B7D2S7_PORTR|nr:hypothetical protein [Portunus trituberculatus]